MPLKQASGAGGHVGECHVEGAAGGNGSESIGDVVRAGHRKLEGDIFNAEVARSRSKLDGFAAHVGTLAEAEPERATGKGIEILVVSHH